jgi:hypothetical protein
LKTIVVDYAASLSSMATHGADDTAALLLLGSLQQQ